MEVTRQDALKFLNEAFRNVDMPRLSEDDLSDISEALARFLKAKAFKGEAYGKEEAR